MEWNKNSVDLLEKKIRERHYKMGIELRTDRKNLSEHWNRHIEKHFGIRVINDITDVPNKVEGRAKTFAVLNKIINIINLDNDLIKNALVVRNPDRNNQYLIVSADIAEKILVFGML